MNKEQKQYRQFISFLVDTITDNPAVRGRLLYQLVRRKDWETRYGKTEQKAHTYLCNEITVWIQEQVYE